MCVSDLQEQMHRAMQLENERRQAEEEAIRLEAERQAALLAKEELARQAHDQMKSQEQLVRTQRSSMETLLYRQKRSRWHLCWFFVSQAAELAEHTARIALLEESKKRKEQEAMTWQHRVRTPNKQTRVRVT